MSYLLLRINLSEKQQRSVLPSGFSSREGFIKSVFSKGFEFSHKTTGYIYEYVGEYDGVLVGFMATKSQKTAQKGKDKDWEQVSHEHWNSHNVFIDPSDHPDGQKIYFKLGGLSGEEFFRSVVAKISNDYPDIDWEMQVGSEKDNVKFEQFVSSYQGEVKSINFRIFSKNMKYDVDKKVKNAFDAFNQANFSYADHTLKSKTNSIDVTSDFVKEGAKYADVSGGGTSVRDADDNEVYSSTKNELTKEIHNDVDIVKNTDRTTILGILRSLMPDNSK